ncbi:hypothetical protein AXF42_Ash013515 [Apostasia shenzhenica]|uniref:Uncharacterized protein n=1 Tax=Apostasia shenzhenica TaxID=1088818 RepID=A0A2I0A4E5_9ASPA|nr:hypothetical protein AXF42_Ash013515 [Apostasia shenzhenica]
MLYKCHILKALLDKLVNQRKLEDFLFMICTFEFGQKERSHEDASGIAVQVPTAAPSFDPPI